MQERVSHTEVHCPSGASEERENGTQRDGLRKWTRKGLQGCDKKKGDVLTSMIDGHQRLAPMDRILINVYKASFAISM